MCRKTQCNIHKKKIDFEDGLKVVGGSLRFPPLFNFVRLKTTRRKIIRPSVFFVIRNYIFVFFVPFPILKTRTNSRVLYYSNWTKSIQSKWVCERFSWVFEHFYTMLITTFATAYFKIILEICIWIIRWLGMQRTTTTTAKNCFISKLQGKRRLIIIVIFNKSAHKTMWSMLCHIVRFNSSRDFTLWFAYHLVEACFFLLSVAFFYLQFIH